MKSRNDTRVRWSNDEWQKFFFGMELSDSSLSLEERVKGVMTSFPADRRRSTEKGGSLYSMAAAYKTWKKSGGNLTLDKMYLRRPQGKIRIKPGATQVVVSKAAKTVSKVKEMISGVEVPAVVTPAEEPRSLKNILQSTKPAQILSPATKKLMEDLGRVQAEIEANISEARRIRDQAEAARTKLPADLQEAMKILHRDMENRVGAMEVRLSDKLDAVYHSLGVMWLGQGAEIPPLTRPKKAAEAASDVDLSLPKALSRKPKVLVFGAKPNQVQAIQKQLLGLEIYGTKDRAKANGDCIMAIVMRDFVRDDEADAIEKGHVGKTFRIKGGATSVVSCIKNHLMIA